MGTEHIMFIVFIILSSSANSPCPGSQTPPFSSEDKRREFCVKKLDPRIHFALVYGAKVGEKKGVI